MLPTNDAVSTAFHLLATVVRDLYSSGRPRLGATLKVELNRRTYNNFSEHQLGFAKFGDFLRAAENLGVVHLTWTPGGDLEVWPPGVAIPQPVSRPVRATSKPYPLSYPTQTGPRPSSPFVPTRVRQDLWNAFNSFSAMWVYDRANDIAYKSLPTTGEGNDSISQPNPNLIPIPAGRERVLDWMRSFASAQEGETKSRLLASLEGVSAPYQFNNVVATDFKVRSAWRRFHIQHVLAAIEAWSTANNVRPKDLANPFDRFQRQYWPPRQSEDVQTQEPLPQPSLSVQQPPPSSQPLSPAITPRLATLIDELIDELLRLRGALQVTGPKR